MRFFLKCYVCFFFLNRLSLKLRNLKILKSGSVSKYILPKCEQCVLAGRFRCKLRSVNSVAYSSWAGGGGLLG